MSKLVLTFLGTSVALGATSWYLVRELNVERESTQTLRAQVQQLEQRVASTQRSPQVESPAPEAQIVAAPSMKAAPAESPRTSVSGQAVSGSARLAPPAAASVAFSSAGPAYAPPREELLRASRENAERQRTLMQNPDYREAMLLQQKAMLPRQYPDLEETLGLTSDQYDQLLSTLANQQLRGMDHQNVAYEGPLDSAARERIRSMWQQQQQENDAELKAVLGDKYQGWKDYQSNATSHYEVNQLRTALAASGVPLEKAQAQALVKTYAAEQQRMAQEYAKEASQYAKNLATTNSLQSRPVQANVVSAFSVEQQERQLKRITDSNQRVRDAAASILTPDQLHQLELQQNQQLQMQEAGLRMMRARAEAGAPITTTVQ